jgi:polyisoprenoid-binding protein YceI
MKATLLAGALLFAASSAMAAPKTYTIDPDHTYPAFEADHMGGLSLWRGKFRKTSGSIVLDQEAKTGTINITVDTNSLDFGHDKMTEHAKQDPNMFDVAKYPTATYKGTLTSFVDGKPTEVQGELTLHGVTKPVTLKIHQFLCKQHPMRQKEVCGADASAVINRGDFGITYGLGAPFNFKPEVKILISVEALADS